jgi:hypothetical protein
VKEKSQDILKLLLFNFIEGQFTHGEITGHGYKYFSSSKCRYKGQFWRGEMHGKGMMDRREHPNVKEKSQDILKLLLFNFINVIKYFKNYNYIACGFYHENWGWTQLPEG